MRELSLHILDALQNSLEAGAALVELTIVEDLPADRLSITIRDNGRGMDAATLDRVADPFFTTRKTRHVGLGIPLFKAAAERCNGDLTIASHVGVGTTLTAIFQHSHLDRAPLGDLTSTLITVILGGTCEVGYVHRVVSKLGEGRLGDWEKEGEGDMERNKHNGDVREFAFHTADIRAELGDVPLTHPTVREWLRDLIAQGEAELAQT
jgi:anti-sigma regulatory factor (Ser/Thr protein kinase)